MPAFGGYAPYPRRCGGGDRALQAIHESLNQQRGTAFDVSETSPIYVENMATARMLWAAWGTNQRLANITNADRCDENLIPRWERIYALPFDPDLSTLQRRARIKAKQAAFGADVNFTLVQELVEAALGDIFVQIEHTDISIAHINVPDAGYPFGSVNVDGAPWSSSVCHFLILTEQPSTYTDGQYYDTRSRAFSALDPVLPAWVTFDCYRAPLSTPVAVTGGASVGGFYLDDEHNLDNNVFSE